MMSDTLHNYVEYNTFLDCSVDVEFSSCRAQLMSSSVDVESLLFRAVVILKNSCKVPPLYCHTLKDLTQFEITGTHQASSQGVKSG